MEVAIFANGDVIGFDIEDGLGSLSWFQELQIDFAVGDEFDPFDVVFFFHGMGDTADLYAEAIRSLLDDGDMFFLGGVGGVRGQQCGVERAVDPRVAGVALAVPCTERYLD